MDAVDCLAREEDYLKSPDTNGYHSFSSSRFFSHTIIDKCKIYKLSSFHSHKDSCLCTFHPECTVLPPLYQSAAV